MDLICIREQRPVADALDPDVVLRSTIGVFERVLVVGYDKEGNIQAYGSLNFSSEAICYAMDKFKYKIMAGEYGPPEDEI